ncbi:outer membrane protein TolC [Breznakibacter xylanolyticus]|uniref:Outer membrane protein TolC n=1 Tax=Breznakibacter xylanolyticus TaxID=990 RepID=A0A2W7N0V7_9BACT|nr:TolC family protein [Breznakibacter xylanolyticus]PZX13710.1 outer membrane protein TolC [Breznakibacter xylanolyticus]
MKHPFLVFQLCLWGLVGTLNPLLAQVADVGTSLSLQQAQEHALSYNKEIQSARLDVNIAKKKVMETTGIGLPQVNVTGSYQHIFKVPTIEFVPGEKIPIMEANSTSFDFTVSQLIFSGEYIVGLQASKVYKTITEQALRKNEIELLQSVESTYHMALVLDENNKIVSQNLMLSRQTLTEMEAMLAAGMIEDTEVDQLRVNVSALENLANSLAGQQRNVLNLLKYQMGMEMSQPIVLTDSLGGFINDALPDVAGAFNPEQNIDYRMVQNQVEVQRLSLKREKSTFLPTLSAFYQHTEKLNAPLLDMTPKDILGAQVTIPIFGGTQRLMRVKQASLELEKAELTREQTANGLALQYANQQLAYETAYRKYLNQNESAQVSRRIFEKTHLKLKEGVASSLELTQVQSQYLTAISNYYNSVLEMLDARGQLQKLLAQ